MWSWGLGAGCFFLNASSGPHLKKKKKKKDKNQKKEGKQKKKKKTLRQPTRVGCSSPSCWSVLMRTHPVSVHPADHKLDSLGGRSTLVTMVTTVTISSGPMTGAWRCIWPMRSSTQPADRRASASWSQQSSMVSHSMARPWGRGSTRLSELHWLVGVFFIWFGI